MREIEKINRYINRTDSKFPGGTPYQMSISDLRGLTAMSREDVSGAICMAFDYGRAKGYRAAKAEAQRG